MRLMLVFLCDEFFIASQIKIFPKNQPLSPLSSSLGAQDHPLPSHTATRGSLPWPRHAWPSGILATGTKDK